MLKGGNVTTEEQNQTSAAATAKLQTYSNAKSQSSDLIVNPITQEQLQKIDAERIAVIATLKPLNYTFNTTITATSPASEIKKMQEVLKENMFYNGDLTGKMDKETIVALMDLQNENGLPQASIAGPKTREVLTRLAGTVGPCQGTLQSVRLKKPNGGEIYQDGQQVLVSWRSCNIPSTNGISISLELYNTNNTPLGTISSSSFSTLNSGSKMITLPTINFISQANQAFSGISFGQHFKVLISTIGLSAYDDSDSFFSINSSQVACTSTTPPNIELLSPNGGEVYEAGQPVSLSWASCNIPVSANLTANLYNNVTGQAITLSNNYLPFPNTGSVNLALPASPDWVLANSTNMTYGTIYKFKIQSGAVNDFSNNLFTINAPQVGCTPKTLTATNGPWNPSGWYVVGTQSNVQFLQTKLTAAGCDIRLSSIAFQKTGFSNNSWVTNLSLYNGATLIADGGQLNSSTGVVTFSGLNVPIPAGSFILLDLKGDMTAPSGSTGTIGFNTTSISGVNLQSQIATILGSFPITGGQFYVVQ